MGPDYVRPMCHDIEDPTFDATAVATNPRAQVRPDPPAAAGPAAIEADQRPHCAWTTVIDESHTPRSRPSAQYAVVDAEPAPRRSTLGAVDPSDEGRADYSGPLLSDLDFAAFSHSALVRIADEVCLQMHLLYLGFATAVPARCATASRGRRDLPQAAHRDRRDLR